MREADRKLNELMSKQFGAVGRAQAREAGVERGPWVRRVRSGELEAKTPRVAVSPASTDCFERRATVGLLDAGPSSAISIESALAFYGVPGFALEPIHISRPRRDSRKPVEGVIWHHPRLLPVTHVLEVNGLRVTTPARALADYVGVEGVHPKRAERVIETTWAARLVNRPLLDQMAEEWCERGRPGSAFLREYLASRPVDFVPAASNLARRFVSLIAEAGMPEPRSEVNVGDAAAWLGRVDCLDPELPLIAEIDSDRFHIAPLDVAHDDARNSRIERAGFTVVPFKEFEVWHRGREVVERWRTERQKLRRAS